MAWKYVRIGECGEAQVSTKPQFNNDHYVPESIWGDRSNIYRYCSKFDRIQGLLEKMIIRKA